MGGRGDPGGDGDECVLDDDCSSRVCGEAGECSTPTCDDGVLNGAESDVDCGGECEPCLDDMACEEDGDCQSALH